MVRPDPSGPMRHWARKVILYMRGHRRSGTSYFKGRRGSLLAVALLALTLLLTGTVGALAEVPQPKNIIYMIGDGMGHVQLEAARLVKGEPLVMDGLPVRHKAVNASLDNAVTDSAAAGTAHATGFRTNNGMVAITPDGRELTSVLRMAKAMGKATGVVVTDVVYGATPGSYLANVNHRSEQNAILEQALFRTQPDVLLGGGLSVFRAIGGEERLAGTPYHLVTTRDELLAWQPAPGKSLLGLFASSTMTYEADRPQSEPHIVEMVEVALATLSQNEAGFFLMVEGSRIDHAGHANDLTRGVVETLAFDQAVAKVLAFAQEHGDTLVVVSADHETGGLTPPGKTPSPTVISQGVSSVANQIRTALNQDPRADIDDLFARYAGVEDLSSRVQTGSLDDLIRAILADRTFTYTTTDHSAAPVPVLAFGPGAELFAEVEHIADMGRLTARLLGGQAGGDQ